MDIAEFLQRFKVHLHPDVLVKGEENNLCNSTVQEPRVHGLCEENLGILRKNMPQTSGFLIPNSVADKLKEMGVLKPNEFGGMDVSFLFLVLLKNLGVPPAKPELVRSGDLKAAQSEIVASKVWEIVQQLQKNPNWQRELIQQCYGKKVYSSTAHLTGPLLVSEEGYVVDGNHRMAAIIAASKPSGASFICVRRIPMNMRQLVEVANKFSSAIGIRSEQGV